MLGVRDAGSGLGLKLGVEMSGWVLWGAQPQDEAGSCPPPHAQWGFVPCLRPVMSHVCIRKGLVGARERCALGVFPARGRN